MTTKWTTKLQFLGNNLLIFIIVCDTIFIEGRETTTMVAIIIIILILYGSALILNPEKHKGELIFFAILAAIFGSFYETTGAKKEWDRRKRG